MKRLFDMFLAVLGLVILSPLLLVITVAIRIVSPGPAIFRQERVGRYGKIFRIHKFRTMRVDAEQFGAKITVGKDQRITRMGGVLRRYKLDELPQLIDVLMGNMSFVGPRPEVPEYVTYYPTASRVKILSLRPGITDEASLVFRDEAALLAKSGNKDPEQLYIKEILPRKLEYYTRYADDHSLVGDIAIIARTVWAVLVK